MNRVILADQIASTLKRSRNTANKSQEYMAKALGVTRKTIQNWEDGSSCPSQIQAYEWFNALCIPPQSYYLELLYPDLNCETAADGCTEDLLKLVSDLPQHMQQKLFFILSGSHGSSPASVIDMTVANLQTPLKDRLNICQNVITNYEIAESIGDLNDSSVKIDIKKLKETFINAVKAVKTRRNSYTN